MQANRAGSWLIQNHNPVDTIWHSALRRSLETAQIIGRFFPGVQMNPSKLLNEVVVNTEFQIEVSMPISELPIIGGVIVCAEFS